MLSLKDHLDLGKFNPDSMTPTALRFNQKTRRGHIHPLRPLFAVVVCGRKSQRCGLSITLAVFITPVPSASSWN